MVNLTAGDRVRVLSAEELVCLSSCKGSGLSLSGDYLIEFEGSQSLQGEDLFDCDKQFIIKQVVVTSQGSWLHLDKSKRLWMAEHCMLVQSLTELEKVEDKIRTEIYKVDLEVRPAAEDQNWLMSAPIPHIPPIPPASTSTPAGTSPSALDGYMKHYLDPLDPFNLGSTTDDFGTGLDPFNDYETEEL
jgi:hypothetical protein